MGAKTKTIYSEKFMTKIMKSKAEYERGEYTVVDPDNFWDDRNASIRPKYRIKTGD
ncbi:MAG: hypothetical protein LBT78_08795 [Tannerella sp.]|nr:hypothetical protein [Tannerella sp.]